MRSRLTVSCCLFITLGASGCASLRTSHRDDCDVVISEPVTQGSTNRTTNAGPLLHSQVAMSGIAGTAEFGSEMTLAPATKTSPAPKVAGTPQPRWPDLTKAPPTPTEPRPLEPNLFQPVNLTVPPQVKPSAIPEGKPQVPLILALECALENRHQEALKHLQAYDVQTQEFLLRILPTLSMITRKKVDDFSPNDVAALNDQLSSLQGYLRDKSDLAIRLFPCEWIRGYAIYKPLPESHDFLAAAADSPGEMVQLYVELKNFSSVPAQGVFATNLSSRLEIKDDKGQTKWSHTFRNNDLKLVSQTRLSEYYHNYTFHLPASLPAGSYTLHVEMTDHTLRSPRTAHASIPLRLVAKQ